MCYPAPPADPGGQRIKIQNVGAPLANYRAAGARCVIVNGVVDPVLGVHPGLLPQAALTICRRPPLPGGSLASLHWEMSRAAVFLHNPG